jgi:CelD/BcsL family acetyltransferase involved in cellulose biosynthesis
MPILCIDPLNDPHWLPFVQAHPFGSVFHTPEWIDVMRKTYGLSVQAYILPDDDGSYRAALPYCEIEDIRGRRATAMPFSDFCDPLVTTPEEWQSLTEQVIARDRQYTIRCLHNEIPLADPRFEEVNKTRWHGIDLTRDTDTIWNALDDSARRAVRKARKQGVEIRPATREEVRDFFNLHMGIRKYKYRLLAQPYEFFVNIWDNLVEGRDGRLLVAVHDGQIISCVLYLVFGDTLVYKFNASLGEAQDLRPTDLLIWEGIAYGKSLGLQRFDFGLSDWDQEGLIRYKRKFATEEKTIHFLRYTPATPAATAGEKQTGAVLGQLTDLFTLPDVPDAVTEQAGALLYRYFV